MNDNHRFFRMVVGHRGSKHTIVIEVLMNRRNLPLKWKYEKQGSDESKYDVTFDFSGNSSWLDPTDRKRTGGNVFGGRKEICICEFEVADDVTHFDVFIHVKGKTVTKTHDGTVHLPGGD